jgi:hypothetical protein
MLCFYANHVYKIDMYSYTNARAHTLTHTFYDYLTSKTSMVGPSMITVVLPSDWNAMLLAW